MNKLTKKQLHKIIAARAERPVVWERRQFKFPEFTMEVYTRKVERELIPQPIAKEY